MARNNALNFNLPSVDDLFSTEESRAEARLEKVVNLNPSEISDFPDHPFKVRMDATMQEMAESVKQYGVLVPALVRPKQDGGYEMVAGHRRKMAAELAQLPEIPCIVRNLTDEQFKALCQIGGTAGLNLYGAFLKDDGPVTFEDVWRHIEHFLELGGEGHIALGGDLDGCSVLPESFTGVDSYELLAQWLEEKHLPAATIEHIFSESLLKVVKQCTM